MTILRYFLDKFVADRDGGKILSEDMLTNKILLEELTDHFKTMLETESVGQRMLYPMSFNILMDPVDYEARHQALPFVLPEIVASFYRIMDGRRKEYPNYAPPAKYWFFQFSACRTGTVQVGGNAPLLVRRGHITTVASLMTFDIKEAANVEVESNTRLSIKLQNSDVMGDMNVNWDAIRNLDVVSDGIFTYRFDMDLNPDTRRIINKSNPRAGIDLALLSYSRFGQNYHYTMKDCLIHISGSSEERKDPSIFIMKDVDIRNSHIQIKYLPEERKFRIATFGPARLNGGKMQESSGGDVIWYDLANHSRIFINDIVSVEFEIL